MILVWIERWRHTLPIWGSLYWSDTAPDTEAIRANLAPATYESILIRWKVAGLPGTEKTEWS